MSALSDLGHASALLGELCSRLGPADHRLASEAQRLVGSAAVRLAHTDPENDVALLQAELDACRRELNNRADTIGWLQSELADANEEIEQMHRLAGRIADERDRASAELADTLAELTELTETRRSGGAR